MIRSHIQGRPLLVFWLRNNGKNLQLSLLIPLLIVGTHMSSVSCTRSKPSEVTEQRYEIQFKKEGSLAFIRNATNDTLALINIEIADSEEKITNGLMWRYSMPDTCGMLFIFEQERPRSFWMKNTYIPLDIVFIGNGLEIVSIQNNTAPLSTAALPSNRPARYVVEVNAWFCINHGISVGDRITWITVE